MTTGNLFRCKVFQCVFLRVTQRRYSFEKVKQTQSVSHWLLGVGSKEPVSQYCDSTHSAVWIQPVSVLHVYGLPLRAAPPICGEAEVQETPAASQIL